VKVGKDDGGTTDLRAGGVGDEGNLDSDLERKQSVYCSWVHS
jgi:hypothetical protein